MSQPPSLRARLIVFAVIVAPAALVACGDAPPPTEAAQARQQATATVQRLSQSLGLTAEAVKAHVNDAAITANVNRRLAADTALHEVSIDVATDGGLVRLTGQVPDETTRAYAADVAAATEGVRDVDNRLQVGADS